MPADLWRQLIYSASVFYACYVMSKPYLTKTSSKRVLRPVWGNCLGLMVGHGTRKMKFFSTKTKKLVDTIFQRYPRVHPKYCMSPSGRRIGGLGKNLGSNIWWIRAWYYAPNWTTQTNGEAGQGDRVYWLRAPNLFWSSISITGYKPKSQKFPARVVKW